MSRVTLILCGKWRNKVKRGSWLNWIVTGGKNLTRILLVKVKGQKRFDWDNNLIPLNICLPVISMSISANEYNNNSWLPESSIVAASDFNATTPTKTQRDVSSQAAVTHLFELWDTKQLLFSVWTTFSTWQITPFRRTLPVLCCCMSLSSELRWIIFQIDWGMRLGQNIRSGCASDLKRFQRPRSCRIIPRIFWGGGSQYNEATIKLRLWTRAKVTVIRLKRSK